jgi:hypothetical protein
MTEMFWSNYRNKRKHHRFLINHLRAQKIPSISKEQEPENGSKEYIKNRLNSVKDCCCRAQDFRRSL